MPSYAQVVKVEQKATRDIPGGGLAWHRGKHEGIWESYKFLRKNYPKASRALLDKFKMSARDGSIRLG